MPNIDHEDNHVDLAMVLWCTCSAMYSRLPVQYAELAFTPTQGPCSRITCAATATRRLHALMSQVVAAAIDEAEAISHTFPHTSPKWENEP